MYEYEESTASSADGLQLFYRCWEVADPKAILVLVHGVGEHSGRYVHVAEHFADRGYCCYAHDYRGHGQSQGKRGVIKSYQEYIDDLRAILAVATQKQPGLPIFTVGHSQGGTIVLAHALDYPDELTGVVASAPALGINLDHYPLHMKLLAKISPLIASFAPGLTVNNGIDPKYLCHDEPVCKAYACDPLVHDQAVLRWYVEFIRTQNRIMSNATDFRAPCLIMHAGDDHLVDVHYTETFYDRLTIQDKQLILYEGFYHELFNEVDKERVFADIDKWLEPRV